MLCDAVDEAPLGFYAVANLDDGIEGVAGALLDPEDYRNGLRHFALQMGNNRFGGKASNSRAGHETEKTGTTVFLLSLLAFLILWRRGWDSDSLHMLAARNLLILSSARTEEIATKAELRYTPGTRRQFSLI
jgi:hypothetical protein